MCLISAIDTLNTEPQYDTSTKSVLNISDKHIKYRNTIQSSTKCVLKMNDELYSNLVAKSLK